MKLAEHCQEAEGRLRRIDASFLEFSPEAIQLCQDEIIKVLEVLLRWKVAPEPLDDQDRSALASFRKAVAEVQARAVQGVNLCFGWCQLRQATGYTSQGRPQLVPAESSASYRG